VPALITTLLSDADMRVRQNAAEVLEQIGPAANAVPALTAALQDPDNSVIEAAKKTLERIQSAAPAAKGDRSHRKRRKPA
jgi:HEAT repeat protein